jgi:DHA2 family multidrug resistance protein-like MFS transporter
MLSTPTAPAMTIPGEGLPALQRRAAMAAILTSVSLATLDAAITNTALPTIARDLGTDAASSIWVVSAYQLSMVAALLPLASLGEIIGYRRVYIAGLIIFTLASLACGLAPTLPFLTASRVIQGFGGAAITGVNLALIRSIFPKALLGRGLGFNALTVAMSFTIGPTVASAILSVATWHWLFLINVPFGAVALTIALRTLPATPRAAHSFDLVAALLSGAMFSLAIFGIDGVGQGGSWLLVALEWAAAIACLLALLRRQSGHVAPMLAIDLFRLPVFALSAVTSVCSFAAQSLAFVSLPFLFQHSFGRTQVEAGFLMTPWPAVVALMAPIAGRLADRYSTGLLGGAGLLTLSLGMALVALLPPDPSVADIIWRLLICGAGFGFFQTPNLKAMMSSAPPQRSGGASGIVATARLFGQATGAALVAVCFSISEATGPQIALWLGCGFAAAASIASLLRLRVAKPN